MLWLIRKLKKTEHLTNQTKKQSMRKVITIPRLEQLQEVMKDLVNCLVTPWKHRGLSLNNAAYVRHPSAQVSEQVRQWQREDFTHVCVHGFTLSLRVHRELRVLLHNALVQGDVCTGWSVPNDVRVVQEECVKCHQMFNCETV